MTSLTSIPAYLWRNTLQRWLENPAAPATKFLVPFLFGLLALFVLGLLRGVETELKSQLDRNDLRLIRIREHVPAREALNQYHSAIDHGSPWRDQCAVSDLLLQAPTFADSQYFQRVPVLSYVQEPSFVTMPETRPGEPRPILLLTNQALSPQAHASGEMLDLGGNLRIKAQLAPLPDRLGLVYQTKAIALLPAEMLEPLLTNTHTRLQLLLPKPGVSPRELESRIRLDADAEGKNLQIFSAQSIVDQLVRLGERQEIARLWMSFGIVVILGLIFGSLSLLEFRQELYLFALLQSFGVRSRSLLGHYLLETGLIAFAGGLSALWVAKQLLPIAARLGQEDNGMGIPLSMESVGGPDLVALGAALVSGILISAAPLIPGLRKPAGLYLQ